MAYDRSRTSTVLDGFTLSPLPYPVLLILALIFTFLGISWYFSYEEVVETAEQQFGWALFATPVVLILLVRWLSSMENSDWFLWFVVMGKAHEDLSGFIRGKFSMGCGCFDLGVVDIGAISVHLS